MLKVLGIIAVLFGLLGFVGALVSGNKRSTKENTKLVGAVVFFLLCGWYLISISAPAETSSSIVNASIDASSSQSTLSSTSSKLSDGNLYAMSIKSDPNHFNLPLIDASLNSKIEGQLWVQVFPGHSEVDLEELGREVAKEYHDKVGFSKSDVIVVEDNPKVEVIFNSIDGKFEIKQM